MPLGTSAPVLGIGKLNSTFGQTNITVREADGDDVLYPICSVIDPGSNDKTFYVRSPVASGPTAYPAIYADLSEATAATINQFRLAIMTQSLLELDARGGTRYVEILRSHFGVVSPDFRLQRAEFLGGGSTRINSHPVPQTSPTSGGNAQAELAAFATMSTGRKDNIGFSKSFVEHGYVIGLAVIVTGKQGGN